MDSEKIGVARVVSGSHKLMQIPDGWRVEAEYLRSSAADRDAAFLFVERVVRIMTGNEHPEG